MEENSEEETLQSNRVIVMERTLTDLWETELTRLFVECSIPAAF